MKRFTLALLFLPILLSLCIGSCWLLPTPTEEWEVASVQYYTSSNILVFNLGNVSNFGASEF
jgi:hypothetical protein